MRELIGDIERWRAAGLALAIARVVAVEGSGPREPGAAMAVNERGEVAGSVSGGCVEGAVVAEAMQAMADGRGARRASFGYADEQAFAVGLTCGGTIHVLVDPGLPLWWDDWRRAVERGEPVAVATVARIGAPLGNLGGGGSGGGSGPGDLRVVLGRSMLVGIEGPRAGSLGSKELDAVVERDAAGELAAGSGALRHYGRCGEAMRHSVEVLVEVFAPPARMVIVGAVDFTAALSRVAKAIGYHVTVCDPRPVFATAARFPAADEVVASWPDRYLDSITPPLTARDAVCVLTHDTKIDVPAIESALRNSAGYLGVMGSRRTHAERVARLRERGATEEQLAAIMAPIGLDLGARTPEETAIAICAEVIALRTGRPARSLRDATGPIHTPSAPGAASAHTGSPEPAGRN